MGDLRLAELTRDNLAAATGITLRSGQEEFVSPVVMSLAEAYVTPAAWPRVVLDGTTVVGFVMAHFDPDNDLERRRFYLWRLTIAGTAQGRGAGRFAVDQVAAETRGRGGTRLSVSWGPEAGGPEGFYRRLGFVPSGELIHGEALGWLDL